MYLFNQGFENKLLWFILQTLATCMKNRISTDGKINIPISVCFLMCKFFAKYQTNYIDTESEINLIYIHWH